MKMSVAVLYFCVVSVFVQAAHLEYHKGKMTGYCGSYAYNAAESDPYDDPNTIGREYKFEQTNGAAMVELSSLSSVSTALADSSLQFTNETTPQGVHLTQVINLSGNSNSYESGSNAFAQMDMHDYEDSNYGIFYKLVSDGEPEGTEVPIELSWLAEAVISGYGCASFYCWGPGESLLVAINSHLNTNPYNDPPAQSVIYTGPSLIFCGECVQSKSDTVKFTAKVGDTVAIYSGASVGTWLEEQIGSNDVWAQMDINLQVLEGRTNRADVNNDKFVNLADLAVLAENWLWAAPPISNQTCGTAMLIKPGRLYIEKTEDTVAGELWYKLCPNITSRYMISLYGSDFNTRLTAYEKSPTACPGNYLSENDDSYGFQSQLSVDCYAFTETYFKVDSRTNERGTVRMEVTILDRPRNDEIMRAAPVALNTTYSGSTVGSMVDAEVWYSFTPQESDYYTISLCGSSYDTWLSVYDTSLNRLEYNDDFCYESSELPLFMTAGEEYLISVGGYDRGDYQLLITKGASVPVNDECQQAMEIYIGDSLHEYTTEATGTDITSSCGAGDNKDLWYSFTAPYSGNFRFFLSDLSSRKTLSIYDSSACPGNELFSAESNGYWFCPEYALYEGQRILIRVAGYAGKPGYFNLSVY